MERNLSLIALFAALTAALGFVPSVTLISGVPISAQSLGVMLCGTILGKRNGTLAVLLFVLLALIGLPILAGGRGGIGVLLSPTAGFLLGFPVAAFVAGWTVEQLRLPIGISATIGAIVGGVFVLYIFGIAGMAIALDKTWIEAAALSLPFLPGDLIKAVLVGVLTASLYRMRPAVVSVARARR